MVEALVPAPDHRVERLEREIADLRKEMSGLMSHDELRAFMEFAKSELKDLKLGVDTVNGHVADVLMELGTVPDHRYREPSRLTVTNRLHKLENDSASARIAGAALAAAEASKEQAWTRWQKIALFLIAVVGMILGILAAVGVTQ